MKKWIIRNFPEHFVYVEVFGGGGCILFSKPPSKIEVYNDIHSGVVNLFRMARDRGYELREKLKLTPYSHEEYYSCLDYVDETDELEKARKFYTVCRQSFIGKERGGWQLGFKRNRVISFQNAVGNLQEVIERLKGVYIDNRDFRFVLEHYDTPETFFFCDPPYLFSARRAGKHYKYEMIEKDHVDFLELVNKLKGKCMICGYPSELYEKYLHGWRREEKEIPLSSQQREKKVYIKEVLWMNY